MATSKTPSFEKNLQELDHLVEEMATGDLPLEKALKTFERGVALTQTCHAALKQAEQQVTILMEKNGVQSVEPFDSNEQA